MKIHVVDRQEPLRDGQTVAAKCGAMVEKAHSCFMWDFRAMSAPLDIPLSKVCTKCRKVIQEHGFSNGKQYVYGVVPEVELSLIVRDGDLQG